MAAVRGAIAHAHDRWLRVLRVHQAIVLVWEAAVPMPSENLGAMGAAKAVNAPKVKETARGNVELYTPKVRNVIFVVEPPITEAQMATMVKYESIVVHDLSVAEQIHRRWAHIPMTGTLVETPVQDQHHRVRGAVLGAPLPNVGVYR